MPTLLRPETDEKRLQLMRLAKAKYDTTAPADRAFSADTYNLIVIKLPLFEQEVQEVGSALSDQAGATNVIGQRVPVVRKFVSHYFQVFNLGISRNIYPANHRGHYLLDVNSDALPNLRNEQAVTTWAQRIVTGDVARVAAGGAAMSNPSAADVQAELALLLTAQTNQSTKKDAYDTEQEDVEDMRPEMDDLCDDIIDEVEFTFRKSAPASKRRKAREWGLVYEPRANETPTAEDFSITGKTGVELPGSPVPLANVQVMVVETNTVVYSNASGDYFVPVQPAGNNYTVTYSKPGYITQTFNNVVIADGVLLSNNVAMVPVITSSVFGTLLFNGNPVLSLVRVVGTALTAVPDPLGNFEIQGITPGTGIVIQGERTDTNPHLTQQQTIDLTPGEAREVIFNFV